MRVNVFRLKVRFEGSIISKWLVLGAVQSPFRSKLKILFESDMVVSFPTLSRRAYYAWV